MKQNTRLRHCLLALFVALAHWGCSNDDIVPDLGTLTVNGTQYPVGSIVNSAGTGANPTRITIEPRNNSRLPRIELLLPTPLATGTYELSEDGNAQVVLNTVLLAVNPNVYDRWVAGTGSADGVGSVTLTEVGSLISGSFTATVVEEGSTRTATVSGNFRLAR